VNDPRVGKKVAKVGECSLEAFLGQIVCRFDAQISVDVCNRDDGSGCVKTWSATLHSLPQTRCALVNVPILGHRSRDSKTDSIGTASDEDGAASDLGEIDCFPEVDGIGEGGHDLWMDRESLYCWSKVDEGDVVDCEAETKEVDP